MKKFKKQEGQIVVILAVAMVAILAVTALAVDGSLVYNDRRGDQSTSDSAALAGAGAAAQLLKDHQALRFLLRVEPWRAGIHRGGECCHPGSPARG